MIDNSTIKRFITKQFQELVGYTPNIDNPKSFNEKIQWLKLYYRNPLLTKCADKYTVRDYVKEKIGEQYLIPLIGVYDKPDQIDFNKLPNKFVLKTNNGSGKNIICKNKKKLNIEETKSKLTEWLKPENSHYFYSYEWAYKDIKPKIICEEYLESKDGDLKDYKFMCFHGKIENIFVCTDRKNSLKVNFYDLNWKLLPFTRLYPNSNKKISKPKYFKKMVEIAEMLAKDFPFVRVDLYENKNNIYFGELTFYPGNGMEKFQPVEWDYKIGKYLYINKIDKNKIKKKNILVTFFSHSSQLGGGERSMLELIKELKEKDIFSHVVLPSEGPLEKELENISVPYDIVNLGWWASQNSNEFENVVQNNSVSLKNLINYLPKLKLINPDLIYSNTIVSPWGAVAANYLDKPHIWHIREYGDKDHQLNFDISYSETISFIENYSNQIIANSNSVSDYISKYLIKIKPIIVYNYINIEANLLKDKISSPFVNQNSLKILVCGTISKGKNQLEAIKVLKRLIDNKIETELLILGPVGNQEYLDEINHYVKENKIEKYIHFLDFVNNPYPFFKVSDIVLITSNKEAYGRTAVEGMLLKKVVVASDSGGTKEIIKNGETGFLYKSGNVKDLENILTKLTDKKTRDEIGINGFKSLNKFNSKEKYGFKIAKIINNSIRKYIPKNKINKIAINIFNEFQSENQNLSKQIEEINTLVSKYQSENQNLSKQIEEINTLVSKYQSENQNLSKQIEEVNQKISIHQNNLNILTSSKYYKIWRLYCKFKDTIKK